MKLSPAILLLLGLAGLSIGAEPGGFHPADGTKPQTVVGETAKPEGVMKLSLPKDLSHPTPGLHPTPARLDRIWSAVIVATNPEKSEKPKETPVELQAFAPKLRSIFGYTQFELAGSATEVIDELTENWLLPSTIFPLKVTARRTTSKEARGGYLLNFKMFQENRPLFDSEVKLAPNSPLFIRGPQYGKGQIILVLQVQH
jgi:hypothetical protein